MMRDEANHDLRRPHRLMVVAILQDYDLGGAVPSACLQQLEALSHQHDCCLITNKAHIPAAAAGIVPRGQREVVPVERVPVASLRWLRRYAHVPRQLLFSLAMGLHLVSQHRRRPPNLLIFHSHPPTSLLAPLVHRVLGSRVLMVMHGDIHDRPSGTYDPQLTWWFRIHTRPAYRRCDGVIALSPYMAAMAMQGGTRAERVHLVPNGMDPEEIGLEPEPLPCPDEALQQLLFIGRLELNKGIDLLLEAFVHLSDRWPQLRLTCIGHPDPRTGLERLLQPLQKAGLLERVEWLPQQPRHQLGHHYSAAGIVVVPSRSETQSTVVMEAMAACRAVVASDTGGNPMLVEANSTGLLFHPGDPLHLATQIEVLLRDPAQLVAMGLAGQRRQRERFSRRASEMALQVCVAELCSAPALQEASR